MLQPRDRAAGMAAFVISGLTAALFLICAIFSFRRHVHVDELTALYSIQLGAAFGHPEYAAVELSSVVFQPLARLLGSSERLFVGFRWLELTFLFALCWSVSRVQRSLPSNVGRAFVFLGAVSFGPLWRHGFELRHDIFVAFAVVLLAWAASLARSGRLDLWAASVTGFGMIVAQANSSKAFTIWLPGLALCALLAARGQRSRAKGFVLTGLRFLPGISLGCLLVAFAFGGAGMLDEYWQQLRLFTSFASAPPYRLSALPLLGFAIARAPVHAGFVLVGVLTAIGRLLTRKPLDEACVPLAMLSLSCLSLLLNPTPFPYNLTWLTPAWLLMAAFGLAQTLALFGQLRQRANANALFATSAAALSLLCFWNCERDPYYRKGWDAQLRVIASAEALTSPSDPVLDLCGLVVSRPPVAKDWVVHSLLMPAYHAGQRETVRQIIERVWPPVAITVYRWSFLDRADWLGFRRHYVRFPDDVWTLGRALDPSSSQFEIQRSGRYQVRGDGDLGTLDGRAVHAGDVLALERGRHAFSATTPFTIAWNGPGTPGRPPPAARPLFEPGELPNQRGD